MVFPEVSVFTKLARPLKDTRGMPSIERQVEFNVRVGMIADASSGPLHGTPLRLASSVFRRP